MSWKATLELQDPLLLPIAHDALSARLVEESGFRAYAVGGFAVVGARLGLPDVGLATVTEMAAAVREMLAVCTLPVLVDMDDGYGDAKNVARTVREYERMGVACLQLEDQVNPKRCGHMAGKAVISQSAMLAKIHAAVDARQSDDTFLLARTDARAVEGLDAALRRAESYVRAGADGLFIEAPLSEVELETIGRSFDVPLLANMLEGGKTPLLSPARLRELGFAMIGYPTSLIFRIVATMRRTLRDLAAGRLSENDALTSFEEYKTLLGMDTWAEIENRARTDGAHDG